ncbi:hypothetical protein NMY22_g7869 [Coprinellus aureogranulatus]|nr:hypothetical protein NMY22_g7869 [Coprinellus aureogranulatus]
MMRIRPPLPASVRSAPKLVRAGRPIITASSRTEAYAGTWRSRPSHVSSFQQARRINSPTCTPPPTSSPSPDSEDVDAVPLDSARMGTSMQSRSHQDPSSPHLVSPIDPRLETMRPSAIHRPPKIFRQLPQPSTAPLQLEVGTNTIPRTRTAATYRKRGTTAPARRMVGDDGTERVRRVQGRGQGRAQQSGRREMGAQAPETRRNQRVPPFSPFSIHIALASEPNQRRQHPKASIPPPSTPFTILRASQDDDGPVKVVESVPRHSKRRRPPTEHVWVRRVIPESGKALGSEREEAESEGEAKRAKEEDGKGSLPSRPPGHPSRNSGSDIGISGSENDDDVRVFGPTADEEG